MKICRKCNTANQDNAKFCKNCGVLIEKIGHNPEPTNEETSIGGIVTIIVILALVVFFISNNSKELEAPVEVSAPVEAEFEASIANTQNDAWYSTHTPLMLPQTGVTERKSKKGNAPLEIHTSSSTGNYFLKIDNINTGKTALKAFIRSGETFSTTLPTGEYEMKYANGESWYGEADLFGPETSYSKTGETFSFDGYNGYTVELIRQVNGNLQIQSIDASSF